MLSAAATRHLLLLIPDNSELSGLANMQTHSQALANTHRDRFVPRQDCRVEAVCLQAKNALAPTMMETNRAKVLTAAVTVVVLADLDVQPSRTRDLLKASAPSMEAYADMIPSLLPIFAGSEGKNTTTEWAFKNAGIVGMRLVDAATAHGLATAMVRHSSRASCMKHACDHRDPEDVLGIPPTSPQEVYVSVYKVSPSSPC